MVESWRYLSGNYSKDNYPIFADISGASTATFSVVDLANPLSVVLNALPGKEGEAKTASINLKNVIDKLASKEKALALLMEFGLSKASTGNKGPIDLFKTAFASFETPIKDSLTSINSMIPMRECINWTIDVLIHRRNEQEKCKGQRNKIISIGRQAKKDQLSLEAIELIADQWHELKGELSGGKQKDYTREENRV